MPATTRRQTVAPWRHGRFATTGGADLLRLVVFSIAAFAGPVIATAAADTVYLKNGRVIHTEWTRVEDGMLVLSQHGGTVSIPLHTVDRVARDTNVESTAAIPPESTAANLAEAAAVPAATPPAAATYPWDSVGYWAERLIEIDRRIERIEGELERLPVYSEVDQRVIISGQIMYFVAERAKWEGFHVRLVRLRDELERSARKAGIAPGALREARQR